MRLIALICHLMKWLKFPSLQSFTYWLSQSIIHLGMGPYMIAIWWASKPTHILMRYTQTANKQHTTIFAGATPEGIFRHKANPKRSMLLCRKSMYVCGMDPDWCRLYGLQLAHRARMMQHIHTQIEAFRVSKRNQESLSKTTWLHRNVFDLKGYQALWSKAIEAISAFRRAQRAAKINTISDLSDEKKHSLWKEKVVVVIAQKCFTELYLTSVKDWEELVFVMVGSYESEC